MPIWSATDVAELDAAIQNAERRLVARDAKFSQDLDQLVQQASSAADPRRYAVPAGIGLAGWLLWRLKRGAGRRPAPRPRLGVAFWVTQLWAVAWPLVRPAWHVRAPMLMSSLSSAWARNAAVGRTVRPMPQPAASVDLQRYAGTWYEVARLPNSYERHCAGQPTANYVLQSDGLQVTNRCATADGRDEVVRGVARPVSGSNGARLELSFAPRWLRALPFAWSDYWILHVESDYSAALVGTPGRRQLWLLSRERDLPQSTWLRLLDRAHAQGYDLTRLRRSSATPPSAAKSAPRGEDEAADPVGDGHSDADFASRLSTPARPAAPSA